MRPIVIAGNWKMNKTSEEALELALYLKENFKPAGEIKVIVAPPFTSLKIVSDTLKDTIIEVAAQNMFYEKEGAYTGEISPLMVKDTGAHYVILGHSERRKYFFETDDIVNMKIKSAIDYHLTPIVCVGETLEERKAGEIFKKIGKQVDKAFNGIDKDIANKIIIAYEPIWAIGTGETASPEQAEEVHSFIREKINKKYGKDVSNYAIILYGGSVKPENAYSLLKKENIDGALVGGASLKGESFLKIIEEGKRLKGE